MSLSSVSYCLGCKHDTPDVGAVVTSLTDAKGTTRFQRKSTCGVCGRKRAPFQAGNRVSAMSGAVAKARSKKKGRKGRKRGEGAIGRLLGGLAGGFLPF